MKESAQLLLALGIIRGIGFVSLVKIQLVRECVDLVNTLQDDNLDDICDTWS